MKRIKCPVCKLLTTWLLNGKCVWCASIDEHKAYSQGYRTAKQGRNIKIKIKG